MRIQLPNGLIDGVDLFNYCNIDELRGKQQDYLVNQELVVGSIGYLPKILEDMILSLETKEGLPYKGQIKDVVWKLSSGDIETILVKVRENTYGPKLYHEATCPHCNKVNKDLRLDLDTLELDVMPIEEILKPKVFILPKENIEVELKPLYLKDLFEAIKISQSKMSTLITSTLAVTVKRLGTKTDITADDIKNLRASDLTYLQEQMNNIKLDGSIDTDIEITCTHCKTDFKIKLNTMSPNFFVPTGASMTFNI